MDHRNITPTVEGGLLATGAVVLGAMAVYLPVLGIIAALLWAVPIAVLTVRQGLGKGIMASVVAGILMALLIEPVISLRLVLSSAPVGLMLGFCVRRGWSGSVVFPATFAVSLLSKILMVLLLLWVMKVNMLDMQVSILKESFDQSFAMYETMGVDQQSIDEARANVEPALELVGLLMPLVLAIMGVLDTAACYFMTGRVLGRLGMKAPQLPPFASWRFPSFFLYLLGFAFVGMYWGSTREIPLLYQAALNANVAAMAVGLVQGLSLFWYLAEHFRISKIFRWVLFVLMMMNIVLLQIVAFSGLFDMLFDYRRRLEQRSKGL